MRRIRLLLLGVVVLLASACQVNTTVDIHVESDGSGTVTVEVVADAEAVALLADAPDRLMFDDLADAGWTLEGPELAVSGALSFTAAKRFEHPDDLSAVLSELIGDVDFVELELVTTHAFDRIGLAPAKTRYEVTGTVDPDPDLSGFVDDFLPVGLDLDNRTEIAEEKNDDSEITIMIRLPGSESTENGEVRGEAVVFTTVYGADGLLAVDASSTVEDVLPRVWALVALLAGLLLVGILLTRGGAHVLARIRTPKGRRRRDVRQRQHRAETRAEEANRPRRRMLRLLIVDVHGVLVRPTDPVEGLLVPLITAEKPDADPQQVRELHRKLVLGRLSVEEFWADVGLGPVADELETRYLSSFRLVPGLHPFLDRMRANRLPVAAIGNQPRAWGDRLRRMAALDDAVASWMVSGEIGSALPEPALFEATRRRLSVDLFDCFYLSNVPEHLDAAKELGMATGLFVAGTEPAPDTDHAVVRGFEDLLRSRTGST